LLFWVDVIETPATLAAGNLCLLFFNDLGVDHRALVFFLRISAGGRLPAFGLLSLSGGFVNLTGRRLHGFL
jgi:hypothetical protein